MTDTDLQLLREALTGALTYHTQPTRADALAALGRVGERIRELERLVARSPQNGEARAEFGPGLPPAGGWKRHMVDDPEYSPEFQDEYRRLWHRDAARLVVLEEALREIAQGAGAFSSDPFEHAVNTIAEMKETARAVLAVVPGELREMPTFTNAATNAIDIEEAKSAEKVGCETCGHTQGHHNLLLGGDRRCIGMLDKRHVTAGGDLSPCDCDGFKAARIDRFTVDRAEEETLGGS